MKKYLLTILALGATMMMACEPANNDDNGGNGEITSRVNEYEDWLKGIEKQLKSKRTKKK